MLILKSNGHFSCLVDITTHNYIDVENDSVFLQIVLFMFMLWILQLTWERSVKIFLHMVHNINDHYIQAKRLCMFFNYEIHIVKIHTLWSVYTYCEDPHIDTYCKDPHLIDIVDKYSESLIAMTVMMVVVTMMIYLYIMLKRIDGPWL